MAETASDLRQDIEQTRDHLDRVADALGKKLKVHREPSHWIADHPRDVAIAAGLLASAAILTIATPLWLYLTIRHSLPVRTYLWLTR